MIERFLLVSLPNIGTIFVGMALFCFAYPRREPRARRTAVLVAACLGFAAISSIAQTVSLRPLLERYGLVVVFIYDVTFFCLMLLFCIAIFRHAFEMGRWDAMFCCSAGYILQNVSHSSWLLVENLLRPVTGGIPQPLQMPGQLSCALVAFVVGYGTMVRRIRVRHLTGGGDRRAVAILLAAMGVSIVLDGAINWLDSARLVMGPALVVLRTSQLLAGILLLALDYQMLYGNRLLADASASRQLASDQHRQYQLSRDTVNAINRRCHDIRHQLGRLYDREGANGTTFLRDMMRLVSVYDIGAHTSNAALDTILTEKGLICHEKGIQLEASLDGSLFSFMEDPDVYALFGSALDLAIRASEDIENPEHRLVDVSARSTGAMVAVQTRGFCTGGMPTNSPELQTLRLVAGNYDGTAHLETSGGMLRLSVLLATPVRG